MNFKKILNNVIGSGLTQVIIAAGVLSAASVGTMRMINSVSKTQKKYEQTSIMNNMTSKIKILLNNANSCTQTFTGESAAVTSPASAPVTTLLYQTGVPSNISKGQYFRSTGLYIEDIRFSSNVDTTRTDFEGNTIRTLTIRVFFRKQFGANFMDVAKNFEVFAHVDGSNNIVSCYGTTSEMSYSISACEDLGGTMSQDLTRCDLDPDSITLNQILTDDDNALRSMQSSATSFNNWHTNIVSEINNINDAVTELQTELTTKAHY